MNMYFDFPDVDGTPISVIQLTDSGISLRPHCHEYYELVLITKGSCHHVFNGVTALAAPGDVLIIPPHHIHCYQYLSGVSLINCDFDLGKINADWDDILSGIITVQNALPLEASGHVLHNHWQRAAFDLDGTGPGFSGPTGNAPELQGMIHLEGSEYSNLLDLLHSMMEEQEQSGFGHFQMKSAFLQLILVLLSRTQTRNLSRLDDYSERKKKLVNEAISYMESNLEKINSSSEIAEKLFLSPAYFRSVFKDITGMTPTNYLNRTRIIRSLEYLDREDLSITEAAAKVGIYDSNYYSRLFKKTMGYSPRHFKNKR